MRLGMCLGAGSVAVAAGFGASAAQAAPVVFDLTTAAVDYRNAEPGLVVGVTSLPGGFPPAVALDAGDSYTFDLFTIGSDEPWVDADDLVLQPISATLFFAGMDSVTVEGTTKATIDWQGVVDFPAGTTFVRNGVEFVVTLSDAIFSLGSPVARVARTEGLVTATISRPGGEVGVVPTPAAAAAGLALLGGAVARRRRASPL